MTNRFAKLAAVAALSTLALTACQGGGTSTTTAPAGGSSTSTTKASAAASSAKAGGAAAALTCPGGKIDGAGSTAQKDAVAELIPAYLAKCGNGAEITYPGGGSGEGIKKFNQGLTQWAGSDSALKTEEAATAKERCAGNDAWNLPMVVGPVAFAYNLDGVKDLVLNAEVISKIFNGVITTWDDPAIKALNSSAKLPSEKITVFFRSKDSGTTENVTKFLKAAGNGAWTADPSKTWAGKVGEGKAESSDVAEATSKTKNSLTYVEWSFAEKNNLGIAKIDNGAGAVELTGATVAKAVSEAKISGTGNDLKLDIKYSGTSAGAYPALLVTYEIVCSGGLEAKQTALLKDFLSFFASSEQQKSFEELGYAPLPEELRAKVAKAITEIK